MIPKVIIAIDVCTDNYYGYWNKNVYYAEIGNIGKTIQNPYKPVDNLAWDKERKQEEDKRETKRTDNGESK